MVRYAVANTPYIPQSKIQNPKLNGDSKQAENECFCPFDDCAVGVSGMSAQFAVKVVADEGGDSAASNRSQSDN